MIMSRSERLIYRRFIDNSNVQWGTKSIDVVYRQEPYLVENLRELKICRKCFHLYGSIKLRNGQTVQQKCHCGTPRNEERWQITGRFGTFHKDFDREYEICYCCGLEIIPSGSRWSLFYCRYCKNNIRAVNEAMGFCIIPYGRHSLMNRVSLGGLHIKDEQAVTSFVKSVNALNRRIRSIDSHRRKISKKQLKRLKMAENAPAIDLIYSSNDTTLDDLKFDAFMELMAFVQHKTKEEV